MNPELTATLTLCVYAALVIVLIARSVRFYGDGFGAALLYMIERVYGGMVFRIRSNVPCPLPSDSGALVVANHRSPVDPIMVWMNNHIRPRRDDRRPRTISFLTASEYFQIPFLGWLIRTMHSIAVDRNGHDMGPTREAIRRLRAGRLVGIFPEGGLNFGTDLREPNPGVAYLALKGNVPVYPCYIHGVVQVKDNMVAPFTRRCRVKVTWGDPIDLSEFQGQRVTQELLVEVTNILFAKLAELGGVGFAPSRVHLEEERAELRSGNGNGAAETLAGDGMTSADKN
ncbi:MAG: lysophospholipid acyltransferase family protein [Planctomycetota bacterium]|nr:lysophospholipid acyltransferase family protein [Planctomycetota bacterium]MDA1247891.1 lysophospholipid acyltransferase family protein [Planctomycetota bacterium]